MTNARPCWDKWKAAVIPALSRPRSVCHQNFNCAAHKHNIFHTNFKKNELEPAITWKLVTCQRITLKNTWPRWVNTWATIRWSDTGQWVPSQSEPRENARARGRGKESLQRSLINFQFHPTGNTATPQSVKTVTANVLQIRKVTTACQVSLDSRGA